MNNLLKSVNYSMGINYIISGFIREYDISKANINILYKYGVLSKEKYEYYLTVDRMTRQIDMGILQREHEIANILKNGIKEAKRVFFEVNNIEESDVLTIHNDAIFLINKIPSVTKFDNIEFVNKNIYTSYYKLGKLEIYYFYDPINNIENIDVKGINDNKLKIHEDYFLEFLKVVFSSAQTEGIKDTLDIIITFYKQYINMELDIGYYRNFDSESTYHLKSDISKYSIFKAYTLEEHNKYDLDISCNLQLIIQLYKYYSSIHLNGNKK